MKCKYKHSIILCYGCYDKDIKIYNEDLSHPCIKINGTLYDYVDSGRTLDSYTLCSSPRLELWEWER
jgi:hypothetical protein